MRTNLHTRPVSRPWSSRAAIAFLLSASAIIVSLNGQTNRAKPTLSLDDEARTMARRVLLRRLLKCGDSYFGYVNVHEFTPLDVRHGEWDTFAEFKAVVFDKLGTSGTFLSPAAALNGLQWFGQVDLFGHVDFDTPKPATRKREKGNGTWGPWAEKWVDAELAWFRVQLKKENGRWFTADTAEDLQGPAVPIEQEAAKPQPSCAVLPIR